MAGILSVYSWDIWYTPEPGTTVLYEYFPNPKNHAPVRELTAEVPGREWTQETFGDAAEVEIDVHGRESVGFEREGDRRAQVLLHGGGDDVEADGPVFTVVDDLEAIYDDRSGWGAVRGGRGV